ncbi:hypothetical protein H4F24_10530 [Vibrio alginolyticus]|uniref:hypothetical protein n=1 Tax=Vibrio TaxID=662 RepID=UPI000802F75A|nr:MULTISPECIES: hypothetical protein [Vibrio]ANP66408.1 hypothetical protein BAU10_16205 [Vibrio alginolyticus]MBS9901879.1 hypothetical protein [Vibrio alginolyticus]MCQ9037437.1 hypothetical protein [Vibrio alginolyticus]MDK9744107.1 hypothetical protein [Vibrio sp. B516a]MDW1899909.1 hypothetical protein [Vibrio sp. Vb1337]
MFKKLKQFDYLTFSTTDSYLRYRIFCQGKHGLTYRIASYFYNFIKSLNRLSFKIKKSDVIFIYSTENQKKSLDLIQEKYKEKHGNECGVSYSLKNKLKSNYYFPELYTYLISLVFFPLAIVESLYSILFKKDYDKYAHGIDRYILSFGQYIVYWFFLSLIKPKIIILSNDHNSEIRVVLSIARKKGIKTIYVQHASPNAQLPPLEQFDKSLLDGQASLDVYHSIGELSEDVDLVGISKLDRVKRIKEDDYSREFISVAINSSFEISNLIRLIKEINSYGEAVRLRLHPGQMGSQNSIKKKLNGLDVIFNDPKRDDLFEFILTSKSLIAGNSNILLEAALLNTPTYYAKLDNSEFDYYGFVKNKISVEIKEDFSNINQVFDINSVRSKESLKYYDHSVGESYFGYSDELICEHIDNLLNKCN